jgi:uncharacterized membrane protein SpoIIM required for sporulation
LSEKYLTLGFKSALLVVTLIFLLMLYLSAEITYIATATPQGAMLANQTRQQIETERQTITAQFIFINNLQVSFILIIPLLGILWFALILINTGSIIGLLASAYGYSPLTYIAGTLILGGLIEMIAYAFLATESLYITFLALTRSGVVDRVKNHSWKSILIYLALLVVGAVVEVVLIELG